VKSMCSPCLYQDNMALNARRCRALMAAASVAVRSKEGLFFLKQFVEIGGEADTAL